MLRLLAATIGPLANVSSIAALVSPWRQTVIVDGRYVTDFNGIPIGDPEWYVPHHIKTLNPRFANPRSGDH
jgi:hypothetical protein